MGQEEWDALVCGCEEVNPFLLWSFLHALEASGSAVSGRCELAPSRTPPPSRAPEAGGCADCKCRLTAGSLQLEPSTAAVTPPPPPPPPQVPEEGWGPQHVIVRDAGGKLVGGCPLYLKGHSYGEYVFDSSWANYSHMLGQNYYPSESTLQPPFMACPGMRSVRLVGCPATLIHGCCLRAAPARRAAVLRALHTRHGTAPAGGGGPHARTRHARPGSDPGGSHRCGGVRTRGASTLG